MVSSLKMASRLLWSTLTWVNNWSNLFVSRWDPEWPETKNVHVYHWNGDFRIRISLSGLSGNFRESSVIRGPTISWMSMHLTILGNIQFNQRLMYAGYVFKTRCPWTWIQLIHFIKVISNHLLTRIRLTPLQSVKRFNWLQIMTGFKFN